MATWPLHDAEAHLGEVLEKAATVGPQIIVEAGQERAVVLSIQDYSLLSRREPTLLEVLLSGPKLEDDDPFFKALERDPNDTVREIDL